MEAEDYIGKGAENHEWDTTIQRDTGTDFKFIAICSIFGNAYFIILWILLKLEKENRTA